MKTRLTHSYSVPDESGDNLILLADVGTIVEVDKIVKDKDYVFGYKIKIVDGIPNVPQWFSIYYIIADPGYDTL